MRLGIQGKWALVCGASKGLGFACAQALAMDGVNLVLVARGSAGLEQAAIKIRADYQEQARISGQKDAEPQVLLVAADITTESGRAQALAAHRGFDILVTNAGGPPPGDFHDWQRDDWLRAIDANMLTPIELIKATVDGMRERRFGRIVNLTSSAVKSPVDMLGLSTGARSGLTGFVAGLARSGLVADNVTINNILPGTFDTDRIAGNFVAQAARAGTTPEAVKAARLAKHPAKRLGRPEELGALCAFLCSQQAGYINGQNLLIDGGSFPGTL